jgi:hypothetical protein
MIKFFTGLIIGVAIGVGIGFSLAIGYYDGYVAREYKDKIILASQALKRADEELLKKEEEIAILKIYIDNLNKQYSLPQIFALTE